MTDPALKPRKAARQARAVATVETIVQAAARILETAGPEGFNTNAVAERAGVSVGSLYQYFPGKQALIAELSRRNAEAVLAGLTRVAAATAGQPVEARLRAFVSFAIAQQGARPRLSRILDQLEEGLSLDTDEQATAPAILAVLTPVLAGEREDLTPNAMAAISADCLALVRTLIDAALDRGEVHATALEATIVAVLGAYLTATLDRPKAPPARL